jgi:hypothetical protein
MGDTKNMGHVEDGILVARKVNNEHKQSHVMNSRESRSKEGAETHSFTLQNFCDHRFSLMVYCRDSRYICSRIYVNEWAGKR